MIDRVLDGRYLPTILTAVVIGAGIFLAYW
jgi:hypothetical protein